MRKHTIHDCLRKRTTEQLELILNYYLKIPRPGPYHFVIVPALEVLEERFVPTEEEIEDMKRMKEKLLARKPVEKD